MYKKKLIYLAMASILPMGGVALAQEDAAIEPATEQKVVEEAAAAGEMAAEEAVAAAAETVTAEAQEPAAEMATAAQEEAAEVTASEQATAPEVPTAGYAKRSREDRWKERDQRYEALKERAKESGVMLPEKPPWHDYSAMMPAAPDIQERMEHMKKMQAMTPEEREAYRMQRYQEMREKADEIGMSLPETPPWQQRQAAMEEEWAKHQEVIKGMTDEERAACHAMLRRHMHEMGPGPMMRGPGHQRPLFKGQLPGYGYGPGPYGPRGNFWDPNQ